MVNFGPNILSDQVRRSSYGDSMIESLTCFERFLSMGS